MIRDTADATNLQYLFVGNVFSNECLGIVLSKNTPMGISWRHRSSGYKVYKGVTLFCEHIYVPLPSTELRGYSSTEVERRIAFILSDISRYSETG